MDAIDQAISKEAVEALGHGYRQADMTEILSKGMPLRDARTSRYIKGIRDTFYHPGAVALSPRDRERCLIAILASRDAGLNLAIHIYCGLMEGLSPREIADTIFLGGIYTGVDRISDGLDAAVRTLAALGQVAEKAQSVPDGAGGSTSTCAAGDVIAALMAVFRPPTAR